jgi:hypothetical protein
MLQKSGVMVCQFLSRKILISVTVKLLSTNMVKGEKKRFVSKNTKHVLHGQSGT